MKEEKSKFISQITDDIEQRCLLDSMLGRDTLRWLRRIAEQLRTFIQNNDSFCNVKCKSFASTVNCGKCIRDQRPKHDYLEV